MPNDSNESQDAVRHHNDALHHKAHKQNESPNSDDLDQAESGLQPEIPKVGSHDAPGG